ncbi:MAG: NAD(+) synthase [Chitinispirillales bacterium]|jgi:NAD+ synthase|nr:NAD(+) synthase [Chitinispirillales bacterium]
MMPTNSPKVIPAASAHKKSVCKDDLRIDAAAETERICAKIRAFMVKVKRRGAVIGLSGGIDSSVTAALCAKSLGRERVLGILMPERHSSCETTALGQCLANHLGIEAQLHEISAVLEAAGCYQMQNSAVKSAIPSYIPGSPFKIVLPAQGGYKLFSLVAQLPDGKIIKTRMNHEAYLQLVAATNFKQRVRKMIEYCHADRLNYAVAGSPNRLEYDQGFFVKNGDGSADIKPIAHLYKTQVYQLAEYLGVPEEIRSRPPTTDTYPMEQSQEEFYFSLSYQKMDLCLFAKNNGLSHESVCEATGLSPKESEDVFKDIDVKRGTTRYLHLGPELTGDVPEIQSEI